MPTKEINQAITKMSYGVYVVTSKHEEKINGCTTIWVAQLSAKPLLITVALAKPRYTLELMSKSNIFAVNILSEKQLELGKHFGFQSGRKFDKFANIPYVTKATGAPIFPDATAYLDCNLWAKYDGGDHIICVGEVVDGAVLHEIDPLIFHQEDFFGG
jgi:flavin reductase (DIM6/NTAB) family NADH-FMN oxidoreductase RutF